MKAQAEQLRIMSETMTSSGFDQRQSNAVIESVALAMETFAVTPEVLEARLEKQTKDILTVVKARDDDINALKSGMVNLQADMANLQTIVANLQTNVANLQANVTSLQTNMVELQTGMLGFQRSMFRLMITVMAILLATVLGLFSTLATQLLPP